MRVDTLWAATAQQALSAPALTGAQSAHVAIIGAGYTGLSAALHISQAGRDVILIDAHQPGWGASGRNGGQVIPGLKHDPDTLLALFGPVIGPPLVAAVGGAPDLVFKLIETHGIACDATRKGWLQLAVSDRTLASLGHRARQWQARGAQVRLIDRTETARLTGSTAYTGALLDTRGGTVQPLAYVYGLARAAIAAGARIFGDSRATRLSRSAAGWRVETPGGSIDAPIIILATNAYADALHPALRRSVVAVPSFQVATEKLPLPLIKTILPEGQSGSDMRRLLRYFRLHDGRLLMGGRGAYAGQPPPAMLRRFDAAIAALFPILAGTPIAYRWGGMVAITPDHLPHLHEPEPGLLAGLGYNGRGVAMATLMGRILADRAAGAAPDSLDFPTSPLRPMKLHRFSRMGVRITIESLRLLDRLSD
jgi:glycine/D-amino acid oxidase-like deaminating enzyme